LFLEKPQEVAELSRRRGGTRKRRQFQMKISNETVRSDRSQRLMRTRYAASAGRQVTALFGENVARHSHISKCDSKNACWTHGFRAQKKARSRAVNEFALISKT
jgi:hypothetical protein